MLFIFGLGVAVLGVCCAFFSAHTLRAVFGGVVLIVLGALITGVVGFLLAAI